MNAENTSILANKHVLFVDDRLQTLEFFIEELERATGHSIIVDTAESLAEAVTKMRDPDVHYDIVVIDLNMPGDLPLELEQYKQNIKIELNEAQTLGMWLHDRPEHITYLYLSNITDAYFDTDKDHPALGHPLNKFDVSPTDFPDRLAQALYEANRKISG
jgi:CheY-like chemotaxis protein